MGKKIIGFIVNPIAGMGGPVGLKGTDGEKTLKRAVELGAVKRSPLRAVKALKTLKKYTEDFQIVTYPKEMGEYEAKESGFLPIVIGNFYGDKSIDVYKNKQVSI
ncbi:hypothetical protein [Maledivibacter halophilus]|uniref:ATP-NAD kinase n=1 Tax=Maledivibacter halophilus TaxID=36842 RepID=A0A1T5MU89_9FIRM|nr:hypothetical protein [Maledivibacter halophilus]SKC91593.1 hypothetical protein SAMN02194393_05349 [Maledivibacter halophilus]